MSYTITFTNGRTLAVLSDQSFDKVSTSITLIGKNVNAYGQDINNNFVGLLENFANISEPRSPVQGQLWFDTTEGRMKVYTTSSFKPVGAPTIGTTPPASAMTGDFWVHPTEKLLYFYAGGTWLPSSKIYSDTGGKTGWIAEAVPTIGNTSTVVANFYVNDDLVAAATDLTINLNPSSSYASLYGTNTLMPGITMVPGYKIYGTATNALAVEGLSPSNFIQKGVYQSTTGTIDILNNTGLGIGTYTDLRLMVSNGVSVLASTIANRNFELRYNNLVSGSSSTALTIDATNNRIGLFTKIPAAALDLVGDMVVRGNLTVLGTSTLITSSELAVQDKNIILGNVSSPSDVTADGGGITLKGTTDKTLRWLDVDDSWHVSDHFSLATGKQFRINGTKVIDGTSLGPNIASAPGLVTLPVLTYLTASNITITGSTIGTVNGIMDMYLQPVSGWVNLGNYSQIKGMADTLDTDPRSTAITKGYFDDKLSLATGGTGFRKTYTLSVDISPVYGGSDNDVHNYILSYLSKMLPINGSNGLVPGNPGYDASKNSYYSQPIGARCNVLCSYYTGTLSTFNITLNKTTTQVNKGTGTNNESVLSDVTGVGSLSTATASTVWNPKVTNLVKSFKVMAISTGSSVGTWTFVANIL
jgi:hypothetical protein